MIAGHVIDEDGDPVPDAQVTVERSIQVNGRKVSFRSDSDSANSEGYFFFAGLKAGSYHLSATPQENNQPLERPANAGPRETFVRTEDPLPLQLAPGVALRNNEIKLRKGAVFRVRGRVSNAPSDRTSLRLWSESEGHNADIHDDGSFSFERVVPGNYTLTISSFSVGHTDGMVRPTALFCHVPVTVSDHDVDGVVAELGLGLNIEGLIRIDGGGRFAKPPSLWIFAWGPDVVTAKEGGTFGWANLSPERHHLNFAPPEDFYTKSIQFKHEPVKNSMIDLTSGSGGRLEIVVAPNPATVTATVRDAKNIKVTLWSDSTIDTKDTEASGTVKFANLAPGEYRILAWQKVDSNYVQIPEFRARFDAQKITLAEGSHENIEVKLIPKSASDAEVAKLQ